MVGPRPSRPAPPLFLPAPRRQGAREGARSQAEGEGKMAAGEEEEGAAAAATAGEGKEAGNGGGYDGKCTFCRIARREEPGTALFPCQVGEGRPGRRQRPPPAALRSSAAGGGPAGSRGAFVGPWWVVVVRCLFGFLGFFLTKSRIPAVARVRAPVGMGVPEGQGSGRAGKGAEGLRVRTGGGEGDETLKCCVGGLGTALPPGEAVPGLPAGEGCCFKGLAGLGCPLWRRGGRTSIGREPFSVGTTARSLKADAGERWLQKVS